MTNPTLVTRLSRVMLGAFLFAGLYVALAPRVLPSVGSWPESVSGGQASALRWLVGLLLGAILMICGYLIRGAIRRS